MLWNTYSWWSRWWEIYSVCLWSCCFSRDDILQLKTEVYIKYFRVFFFFLMSLFLIWTSYLFGGIKWNLSYFGCPPFILVVVVCYFSGGGGLHGGKDTNRERAYDLPCYQLFLLASAEMYLCFLGLQSSVCVGCCIQDAPSLLHRLPWGPKSQYHVSSALG